MEAILGSLMLLYGLIWTWIYLVIGALAFAIALVIEKLISTWWPPPGDGPR